MNHSEIHCRIFRHPESDANKEKKIASSSQIGLSSWWQKSLDIWSKSKSIQEYVNTKPPLVVTWTQLRSKIVADTLKDQYPWLQIIESSSLNERSFWIFGWIVKQELIDLLHLMYPEYKHNNNFSLLMDENLDIPWWFESNYKVQLRIKESIHNIIRNNAKNNDMLFVGSTWIIRNALAIAFNKTSIEIDSYLPNNKIPNLSRTDVYINPENNEWRGDENMIGYLEESLKKKIF